MPPLTLTPGARLGPYEILSALGAGGMGEVYRAADTNLKRQVAIKVLPAAVALDADRLARFQREAEVLAALNHPNIAHIHGLEKVDGTIALVMELVEGPTLADRITRGPVPLDAALAIAGQIAEALEAAHEQGIIHRDLKPANIKLRPDGMVKVLDFGLAKLTSPHVVAGLVDVTASPTITSPAMMTAVGVLLGTAAYMSPEQAKGREADKRSDIWAFGCVLYEMLTGTRAFEGDGVSETLARVIEREPVWNRLPATLSPALRTYLERCLQKDPRQRIRDIGDVRLALEGAFEAGAPRTTEATTSSAPRGRPVWMAAFAVVAVLAAALAIPAMRYLRETPPPAPFETRLDINTPATDQPTSFALSPDGRQIVFVASGGGTSRLWLRSLATTTAQPLADTEGATAPFWSPDSRSVGFFAVGALKRLDFGGGTSQTLAPVFTGRGGTWNTDGIIVFAPNTTSALMRVSATGGAVTAVTTLGPQQTAHLGPRFLPDGRRFLFYVRAAVDTAGIYLGALDGSPPIRLTLSDSSGEYLSSGWLLWVRAGRLVAQRLDLTRAALTGEPVTLADGVAVESFFRGAVSVAGAALVAYRTSAGSQRQLTWVDRSGIARGIVGEPDVNLQHPRVSPDGRRVAVDRTVQGNRDLWLLDGARTSRLTFDAADDEFPVWSPDGTRIVFRSLRTGVSDLYHKLTSGAGTEERFVASDQNKAPTAWSADGRFLLYLSNDPQAAGDLWVVPISKGTASAAARSQQELLGDRMPSVFLRTPFREVYGAFSPDGRWVAYQSNESGRPEIYVRPFVPPGAAGTAAGAAAGQWQVSTAGGISPAWRPDGKELYYLNPAGAMMAAPITAGITFAPGAPVVLFPARIYGGGVDAQQGRQYDIAPDGRFLINTVLDDPAAPITLLQNWHPEVQ